MGKKLDIKGKRFNYLVAIKETEQRDNRGSIIWQFECDCGNKEVYKVATDVKSGSIRSCGCIRPNAFGNQRYTRKGEITLLEKGTKIGRLTILGMKENLGYYRGITYECECDCGKKVDKKHFMLKGQMGLSCGCLQKETAVQNGKKAIKFIDITGMVYGNLTAVKCLDIEMKSTALWEFNCECGNKHQLKANDFKRGRAYSCGCVNSKTEVEIRRILDFKNIKYKQQYWFKDLKGINGGYLRFDFGILNKNNKLICLIEYDGFYHFYKNDIEYKGINVHESTKKHDNFKNIYCKENNILLYRTKDSKKLDAFIDNILEIHKKETY